MVVVCCLAITACNPCADELRGQTPSPDGSRVALLFGRDCGATTPLALHVTIRSSSKRPRLAEEEAVFIVEGQPSISMRWRSENELLIEWRSTGSAPRIFKASRVAGPVTIIYESHVAKTTSG